MKNLTKCFCLPIFFMLLTVQNCSAQDWADPQGVVRDQLLGLINSRYGSSFQYVQYSIIDTLITYSNRDLENIQDPYGTLKGCILFSTYKDNGESEPDTFIVGMMKNGQIIWDNAPGTSADLGGQLLYAKDINNDGEVELLVSETDRNYLKISEPPFLCYLYVLSWNGTSGQLINAFQSNGKSAMMGDGSFELVDKDGDGIQEIRTSLPDIDMDWGNYTTNTYPYVTYGWSGGECGLWPDVEQIRGDESLPANRISVAVRCSIEKNAKLFCYSYSVSSDSLSKQIVSDIYIGGLEDTTSNLAPPMWQSGSSSYIGGRAFIKYSAGTYYLIHPGQTMGGFETISSALPTIVNY